MIDEKLLAPRVMRKSSYLIEKSRSLQLKKGWAMD
jgi:hypothetical protein